MVTVRCSSKSGWRKISTLSYGCSGTSAAVPPAGKATPGGPMYFDESRSARYDESSGTRTVVASWPFERSAGSRAISASRRSAPILGPRANTISCRNVRLRLINRGPQYCAVHVHAREMNRHEYHVARLEPHVGPGITTQQIVVEIERRDRLAVALHLDAAQLGAFGHAARRIQRR